LIAAGRSKRKAQLAKSKLFKTEFAIKLNYNSVIRLSEDML